MPRVPSPARNVSGDVTASANKSTRVIAIGSLERATAPLLGERLS